MINIRLHLKNKNCVNGGIRIISQSRHPVQVHVPTICPPTWPATPTTLLDQRDTMVTSVGNVFACISSWSLCYFWTLTKIAPCRMIVYVDATRFLYLPTVSKRTGPVVFLIRDIFRESYSIHAWYIISI